MFYSHRVSDMLVLHPSNPRSIINSLVQKTENLLKHGLGLEKLTKITSVLMRLFYDPSTP